MRAYNIVVPTFAFIDAGEHDQDFIERQRIFILHTSSLTLMEIVYADVIVRMDRFDTPLHLDFNYYSLAGVMRIHRIYVVKKAKEDIGDLLMEGAKWYADYLTWHEKYDLDDANLE